MYLNPDFYSYNNLKDKDKAKVDLVDRAAKEILDFEAVDEYLETRECGSDTLCKIQREILHSFVAHLREKAEYVKTDLVIEAIEGYSDEDLKNLRRKNKQAHSHK